EIDDDELIARFMDENFVFEEDTPIFDDIPPEFEEYRPDSPKEGGRQDETAEGDGLPSPKKLVVVSDPVLAPDPSAPLLPNPSVAASPVENVETETDEKAMERRFLALAAGTARR